MTVPGPRILMRLRAAFTLVELVVVVVVVAVLATIAIAAFSPATESARVAQAQANLRGISMAVLARAAMEDVTELTREHVIAAIEESLQTEVVPGATAGATWTLGGRDFVPQGPTEFSVAFDDGTGIANDEGGISAVLVTSTGSSAVAHEINWNARAERALPAHPTIPDQPTSEDYLDNNPPADLDPIVSAGGGWVGYGISDGWRVEVDAPAYGQGGPILVTVFTPLSNRDLTNERVLVDVTCTAGSGPARPVNSKDHESMQGDVILEREFSCDGGGGFASLTIAPKGRLAMATGTYYAYGNPAYPG